MTRSVAEDAGGGTKHFLGLPLELLLVIADELPLHSKIILSQTCKTMRSLLPQNCESTRRISSICAYRDIITALAYDLPDFQICSSGMHLHSVDPADVPYACDSVHSSRCNTGATWKSHTFGLCYILTQYHVHLALKYSRLDRRLGDVHKDYLQRLMAPHQAFRQSREEPSVNFYTRPSIENNKLILYSRWTLHNFNAPVSMAKIPVLKFCQHLTYRKEPVDEMFSSTLESAVNHAFINEGLQSHHTCSRCPTDYSITVSADSIVFDVWQDLGCGRSPLDVDWQIYFQS